MALGISGDASAKAPQTGPTALAGGIIRESSPRYRCTFFVSASSGRLLRSLRERQPELAINSGRAFNQTHCSLTRLQKNLEGARRHCRICGSHSLTDGTQDVKPQRQRSQDATGFLSLGVDEEWETLHEAKPVEMSLIREEGEEEKGTQPKPEQGAASGGEKEIRAEEEAEEGSDGGPDGPCAPGAMNDENHEASDDSGGEPGEQRQEEQPLQAIVQRQQPRDREQVVQRPMLTLVQVQELERIFRYNAYPNLFMRQQIARRIDMPEARVQARQQWFQCLASGSEKHSLSLKIPKPSKAVRRTRGRRSRSHSSLSPET
ncbi:Homeobox protein ESX1 [Pteropus alecto]|uniref:Homeobox protein ESX1 n=1 Tax=Pteropus alecto TaxID=9402 RepID=L5K865_PTEAL|nr:Homeobox protein ESX1 [Pteropus alecto]